MQKSKKIFICQSNYIPWKGYFDIINHVDYFVLYDVVQYTKNDWRNRNIIKSRTQNQWLTIPVSQKKLAQTIDETEIDRANWYKKHWNAIKTVYGKAPYFSDYKDFFENLYLNQLPKFNLLSDINESIIKSILTLIGSKTIVISSKELRNDLNFNFGLDRNERLIDICKKLKCDHYISGNAAECYLDKKLFNEKGIEVSWTDYSNYPEYGQMGENFTHAVSFIDLLFNVGLEDLPQYMKYL